LVTGTRGKTRLGIRRVTDEGGLPRVRMYFRTVQVLFDPVISKGPQLLVAQLGRYIYTDEPTAFEEMRVSRCSTRFRRIDYGNQRVTYKVGRDGYRKGVYHADAGPGRLFGFCFSYLTDRALYRSRAQCDIDLACRRSCHRQHESRGIAKVAVELDRPGSLRQFIVERIELEIDVGKLLLRIGDAIVKLHVGKRQ